MPSLWVNRQKICVTRILMEVLKVTETSKVLAIDDMRDFPGADHVARSAQDGLRALREDGPWALLYLDHDLASFEGEKEITGYDILCWLEEHPQYAPERIELVTSNPVGRGRMEMAIRNIMKRKKP